jgi:hypothetical protein
MNYPKVDTIQIMMEILDELSIKISQPHIEIIKQEIEKYKEVVLKDTFKIEGNPIPEYYAEVYSTQLGKGVFILFKIPLKFVEIVDEDGNKAEIDGLLKFYEMIGLFISKKDPFKTQLSIVSEDFIEELKSPTEINIKNYIN